MGTCSRTAPCRTFSYAMSRVEAGGEVIALDTAAYGSFTIDKSVSVYAPPGITALVDTFGTGIVVMSGASVVVLRGLTLEGMGPSGTVGVSIQGAQSVSIENCSFKSLVFGLKLDSDVYIKHPTVQIDRCAFNDNNNGIYTQLFSPDTVGITISNSAFRGNLWAFNAGNNTHAAVTGCSFSDNDSAISAGAPSSSATTDVTVVGCTISNNRYAIFAGFNDGVLPRVVVRLAHDMITGNATALVQNPDAEILSMVSAGRLTNTIEGNGVEGTISGTYEAK